MSSLIRSGKMLAAVSATVLGLTAGLMTARADQPATPATQPAPKAAMSKADSQKQLQALAKNMQDLSVRINDGLGGSKKPDAVAKTLADATKREAAAPTVIPLINERKQVIEKIAALKVIPAQQISSLRQNDDALLYLLGDAATKTRVETLEKSDVKEEKIDGQSIEIFSQWLTATDGTSQGKIVDQVTKLDTENPDQSTLTNLTLAMAQRARTADVHNRLIKLVMETMTDPTATQIKTQMAAQQKAQADAEAKLTALENKPFSFTAKTPDGKDFSTDSLKGKVVMIDFWATWCGPCKAGLPEVKETYKKYHDQGFEIVGISNDYAAKDLTDFIAKNDMPWTQVFDPSAAAEHQWHPLSQQYGVNGIPRMFLIDKKGILRTVEARANMQEMIPKLLAE